MVFGTAAAGTARWLTYAAFLYVPVGVAWLRGVDFAEYGLFLRNRKTTLTVALVSGGLVLGAFAAGYVLVVRMTQLPVPWDPSFNGDAWGIANFIVTQIGVVALAEEFFYRGYVQSRFDHTWAPRWKVLGAALGPGWILTSLFFAVGHLADSFNPMRLLTFFPGLWFGWARARTGNVYAAMFLHAASNLLIAVLQGQYLH